MFYKYLFIVLLFHGVLSDDSDECIKYYFEDYNEVFTRLQCMFSPGWDHESYDNSTIEALDENSKWFIRAGPPSPSGDRSCTSSFPFTMMSGGVVEANVYLETVAGEEIRLDMMQITEAGVHRTAGTTAINAATGWRVMRVTDWSPFTGNPPFQGYVRFRGLVSEKSVMIVDSFRYIPLGSEDCVLYEDTTTTDIPTTTPTPTTIPTTTSTTTTTTITTTTSIPTQTTTPVTTTSPTTTLTYPTTDPETTTETAPTTTPTTPITTPPNNLTNYYVEELVDFRKSVRISKRRIKKVVNFNEVEKLLFGLE